MALKGDLHSVPLGDVLQTLAQNEKDGTLQLQGPDYSKSIYCCKSGITLLDPEVLRKRRFGDIVIAADLTERSVLERTLQETGEMGKVGEVLVEAGVIDAEARDLILRIQIEEEIFSLFELSAGEFEFLEDQAGEVPQQVEMLPLFNVEGIIFEAARRMDEWDYIRHFVGDLDMVFIQNPERHEERDPAVLKVLEKVDGRRTLQNISDSLLASPFEVAKIAAGLVESKIVRPAEKNELLTLAQDLIDDDKIERAGVILKKLRPNLKNIILGNGDVSGLADLFYKVGDILTATNILLDKVRSTKDSSMVEDGLPFLKQAHEIAPDDTRILNELAKIYADLGDREVRLQYLISLAQQHVKSGRFEGAIQACREILEVDPKNTYVIEHMPQLMGDVENKQEAMSFLEELAESIGKKADPNHLCGIYRKILKIDPTRKDIKDKLQKSTKAAATRGKNKPVHYIAYAVIIAGSSLSWYLNTSEAKSDMDQVAHATLLLAKGDYLGARSELDTLLPDLSDPDAVEEAQTLLASIEHRMSLGVKMEAEIENKKYVDRVKVVHDHLNQGAYAAALPVLQNLAADFETPQFEQTTRNEISRTLSLMEEDFSSLGQGMEGLDAQAGDDVVQATYDAYASVVTHEKLETLHAGTEALRGLQEDDLFKNHVTPEVLDEMAQILEEGKVFLAVLEGMETRLTRLHTLTNLSELQEAVELAEEEGRLDDALDLYTRLAEAYGEGSMKGDYLAKKEKLEDFFLPLQEVETRAAVGDVESAHALAVKLLEDYPEPEYTCYVKIPVLVTSIPDGALIRSENGRELGTTPRVFYLQGTAKEISIEYDGFADYGLALDGSKEAVQTIRLSRETRFEVELGSMVEAQPLMDGDRLYVASRGGFLFQVDLETGDILKKFNTGSLSGISSSVVKAFGRLYFITIDGELWAVDPDTFTCSARFALSAGTRFAPQVVGDQLLTACFDGKLALHDPDLETVQSFYEGKGKIVADPVIIQDHVLVAYSTGDLVCLGIGDGREKWRFHVASGSIAGCAGADEGVILCSDDGWVKFLDLETGEEKWFTELNAFISLAPVVEGSQAYVAANRALVRLDAATGEVMQTMEAESAISTLPAVTENHVCFGTRNGELHYRALDEEKDDWTFFAPRAFSSMPLITPEVILATDVKGRFFAVIR